MAGEIFIADKNTLDAVDTKVGFTTDTGGSTAGGSMMGKLNRIIEDNIKLATDFTSVRGGYIDEIKTDVDELKENDPRKGFTAADLITNKRYVFNTVNIPATATMTNVLNIVSSGYLYLAVGSYAGDEYNNKTVEISLTVDGVSLFNYRIINPVEDGTIGLVSPDGVFRSYGGGYYMSPSGNNYFNFSSLNSITKPFNTQTNTPSIVYIPKPVRFNTNIKIAARVSGSNPQFCSFMYELD